MRTPLLASAALLGLALAAPAFAQSTTPGSTGGTSTGAGQTPTMPNMPNMGGGTHASTDNGATTPGQTATGDQTPIRHRMAHQQAMGDGLSGLGTNASPQQYLQAAQTALQRHRTAEAQEALARAETRLLDRATRPSAANEPDNAPVIQQITQARQAIDHGDTNNAHQLIASALTASGTSNASASGTMENGPGSSGGSTVGAGSMGSTDQSTAPPSVGSNMGQPQPANPSPVQPAPSTGQ